jgi:Co/Zn/Cd efflux system component
MSSCCKGCGTTPALDARFRRVVWIALAANAAMFVIEATASWRAHSTALLADSVDFLGDTANYGVSLAVMSMAMVWRSRVALLKGVTMGVYGVLVLLVAAWNVWRGAAPEPAVMAGIGLLALAVNFGVAMLLYAFRDGDANMRAVWLCTRNDVIGNLAVLLAAAGVFGTGTLWPDVVVAALMAALGIHAAVGVTQHASSELRVHRREGLESAA